MEPLWIAILLVAALVILLSFLYLYVRCGPWFAWRCLAIGVGSFVLATLALRLLPGVTVPVLAGVTVVSICLFLGLAFIAANYFAVRSVATHKLRRSLREMAASGSREQLREGPPPAEVEARAHTLEQLGFKRLFAVEEEHTVKVVLLRSADSVIGEVVGLLTPVPRIPPGPEIELTSMLLGWRGLACTGTSGLRVGGGWAGELRQVFPGAEPGHLVEYHEALLRLLTGRAIEADSLTSEQVREAQRWGLSLVAAARANTSTRELRASVAAFGRGVHADVGLLSADSDVEARISAFWEAVRTVAAPPLIR